MQPEDPLIPQARPIDEVADRRRPGFWLINLFLRPRRFFEYFPKMATRFTVIYSTWIIGMELMFIEVSSDPSLNDSELKTTHYIEIMATWDRYLLYCAGAGLVAGALYWVFGGWWYRARIGLAGHERPDKYLARRIYVFASMVHALPAALVTGINAVQFSSPIAAESEGSMLWVFWFLTIIWSLYTSYRGVRVCFNVRSLAAKVWFLIIPGLFYGALLGIMTAYFIGVSMEAPAVDMPMVYDSPRCRLQYPSNWWVERDAEDDYAAESFTIEPWQDAVMHIYIYDEPLDPEHELDVSLSSLRESMTIDESPDPIESWGRYAGAGMTFTAQSAGAAYRMRLFVGQTDTRAFEVTEWAEASVADFVEPGFKLIRDSFELKTTGAPNR